MIRAIHATPTEDLVIRTSVGFVSGMILANVISPILGTFSMPASRAIIQHGTLMIFSGTLGGLNGIRTSLTTDRVKMIASVILLSTATLAKAALDYFVPVNRQAAWVIQ